MLKRFTRFLLRQYQRLSFILLCRLAPSMAFDGIRIFDGTAMGRDAGKEGSLAAVLELIKASDPRRFKRMQKTMPTIALMPIAGAEYHRHLKACYVEDALVDRIESRHLASILIHESTHAYLHDRGCRWTETRYQRIEKLCVREEIRFARRLNDPDLERRLAYKLDNVTPLHGGDQPEVPAHLQGMPRWVRRIFRYANRFD